MNKQDTSTATKEDVDITYRKMAIAAGWQLYKPASTFSSGDFIQSVKYFSQNAPYVLTFNPQTIDFFQFLESEPDSTYISATCTAASITTVLAITLATLY